MGTGEKVERRKKKVLRTGRWKYPPDCGRGPETGELLKTTTVHPQKRLEAWEGKRIAGD